MTDVDVPSAEEAFLRLFAPAVADDPHPTYAAMRAGCPVARGDLAGAPVALVSRYDDVHWALRHPEHFSSAGGVLGIGEQPLIPLELRVALEELHARISDYRLPDGFEPHFSPGIRQADPLLLEFEPA